MDEVEQMKQCLAVLRREGQSIREREGEEARDEEDDEEQESAFEILSELCENLDNARGLYWAKADIFRVYYKLDVHRHRPLFFISYG